MINPKLENSPLIEVVFELRWELSQGKSEKIDPFYEVLLGRFYDIYKDKYPCFEKITNTLNSDELPDYIASHRFKQHDKDWPTIQLGPGIISLHDAGNNYKWEQFEDNLLEMLKNLFKCYPVVTEKEIKIDSFNLSYLNALRFDFNNENIFDFLKEKMNIDVNIKDKFFGTKARLLPFDLDVHSVFFSNKPVGIIDLSFRRGKIREEKEDCLMWETGIAFYNLDIKEKKESIREIITWAKNAHKLLVGSFLKVIKEGNLETRFI
jgi:uncharacterized protein (TIGR04255 family)